MLFSSAIYADWSTQTTLTATDVYAVVVDPIDQNKVYVGTTTQNDLPESGLYMGTGVSSQKTWEQITSRTFAKKGINSIAIVPDNVIGNQRMFVAVTLGGISKSTDGGLTWIESKITNAQYPVPDESDLPTIDQIVISKNINGLQKLYAYTNEGFYHNANNAGLYTSSNDGLSWNKLTNSSISGALKKIAVDINAPNTLYVATSAGELLKSTDGGINFIASNSGLPTGASSFIVDIVIDPTNSSNLYASVFDSANSNIDGLYYSANAGVSWTLKSSNIMSRLAVTATSTTSNKLYGILNESTTQTSNNVFVSSDHGTTWSKLDPLSTNFSNDTQIRDMTVVNEMVYIAANNGLYTNALTATTNPIAQSSTETVAFGSTIVNGTFKATPISQSDSLSYAIVNNPSKGSVVLNNASTGAFTYTVNAGQTGTDTITFRVTDQLNRQSQNNGTVTINIQSSAGPTVTNGNATINVGSNSTSGTLLAQKVSNTDILTYVLLSNDVSKGTMQLNTSTGVYTYTAIAGQTGTDTVTFRVRDQLNRESAVGTLTITLPGGSTAIDLQLTGTATPNPVQLGGDLTYNLAIKNLSTSATTGQFTLVSDAVPAGASLVNPGSNTACSLQLNNTLQCTFNTLRHGGELQIQIILRLPANITGSQVNMTFTVSTNPVDNTSNNQVTLITNIDSSGPVISAPVVSDSQHPQSVAPLAVVNGTFPANVTKVNQSDTIVYVYVRNDTSKGSFRFRDSQTNESSTPNFVYTAAANAAGQDIIYFKVKDSAGRESIEHRMSINFSSVVNQQPIVGGDSSPSGSGGAINPYLFGLVLLPIIARRRKR